MMRMHVGDACKLFSKSQVNDVEHVRSTLQLVSPSLKVTENGSKDFSAFLHEVRGPKSKFGSTAGFSKKNLNFALFGFLWSKWLKIRLFVNLLKNGSADFAHIAYLDRSHQYLQLFY